MKATMQSLDVGKQTLALLLLACVMLAQVQGSLAGPESDSNKGPKIRRTIRVVETPSAEEPADVSPQNLELQKQRPSNNVEVNPTISVGVPPATPTVSDPKKENKDPSQDESQLKMVPFEPKVAPVDSHLKQLFASDSSHNEALVTHQNSGNQLVDMGANNNNVQSKELSNSDNTEQVHIDGVGNNKITRITNVGNTDEQHIENVSNGQRRALVQHEVPNQLPVQQTAAPSPSPLVQITMNNDKQPQLLASLPYASQQVAANWPIQMVQPNLQQLAAPKEQNLPMFQQPINPFMVPSMMPSMLPSIVPSMVPPMMPSMVPSMMPSMMPSMVPSMVPSTMPPMMVSMMVTPRQWSRLMRASQPRRHYHDHHHPCPHHNKKSKANRKNHKKSQKDDKSTKPKPVQQKEEVVVIPPAPVKEPTQTVVQLVKPKEETRMPVVLNQVSPPKPEEKEPIVVVRPEKAKDEDEEEEVIEWETVRVPRKKRVMRSKKN